MTELTPEDIRSVMEHHVRAWLGQKRRDAVTAHRKERAEWTRRMVAAKLRERYPVEGLGLS